MDRIIVLGSGGAGKSTLARKIGELLDIEVIHLDSYYWQPNWVATPDDEWMEKVKKLLERERWVMDGNYTSSLDLRIKAADTVVFLDRSRLFCLWRVIKRLMKYRGENRPEMAEGCREKIDLDFLNWIWHYPRDVKPRIEAIFAKMPEKRVIRLRNSKQAELFLEAIVSDGR